MIAIVGYFLLNNILSGDDTPKPNEVLDKLDASVTSTFKQNEENSKLKDGMDMVICRIDLSDHSLECASANRPIYKVDSNGILSETKGDKFPIGGGTSYSNKTLFKNHKIELETGDSIYFFSDGLPDQFDETNSKKFGSKRIKDTLINNYKNDMTDIQQALEDDFQEWKGSGEQTDDILFIGLRF